MDTTHTTAIHRICCVIIFYFISNHNYLTDATPMSLEFCMSTYHTSNSTSETGAIKSPGFQRTVAAPGNVPSKCTIYITVCSGCRVTLINTNKIDCDNADACFLQRASVTLKGFPLETLFFNSSALVLNVTSFGRSVELVFNKSPNDPVTGKFGFNIFYEVMKPEPIRYTYGRIIRSGTFSSPGFPDRYASNGDTFSFQLQPPPRNSHLDLVLSFNDWYLSKYSKVTMKQGSKSSTYNYLSDRPNAISTRDIILITFETGIGDTAQNYIGFKATYEYVQRLNSEETKVRNEVFDLVFGGAINFEQAGPDINYDIVWVIPKSALIGSGNARLKLRISNTNIHMRNDVLEIRSGPTSEDTAIKWEQKTSYLSEHGFYLRLRSLAYSRYTIAFNIVYAWTGDAYHSPISHQLTCLPTDFVCYGPLECLKSKDLACDGIRHCDGETDESDCYKTSKPCSSYWTCRTSTQNPICITRRCDGVRDCLDSSDEIDCTGSTLNPFDTTTLHPFDYADHDLNQMTLSIALPFVVVGIMIIVTIIGYFAIRRKQHLSLIRQTLQNEEPAGSLDSNIDECSAHFTPTSDEIVSPPSYSEVVLYSNQDFATSTGQLAPPPYEEIAKSLGPVESLVLPPPYILADETGNIRENRTSRHRSGEQRTSPRHSGEQRTSPRHSSRQRTSGSRDSLISGNSQC